MHRINDAMIEATEPLMKQLTEGIFLPNNPIDLYLTSYRPKTRLST